MSIPDLAQLAASIIAILTPALPLLQESSKSAAGELGKQAVQKASALLAYLRARFQQDNNTKAEQTLGLFQDDPATFEGALSKILLQTLEKHPEWAEQVRTLLVEPSLQEIVARNQSEVTRITMNLTGAGQQRIEADNSKVIDVKMSKK